jgi:hypothetical protein
LDLVNRSAIWYLRELEEVSSRGDLTAAGALCLLYQERLLREKTREAIQAGADAWKKNFSQPEARQRLAAAGRWMDWSRAAALAFVQSACLAWLQFGPPIWQRQALQRLMRISQPVAPRDLDLAKPQLRLTGA